MKNGFMKVVTIVEANNLCCKYPVLVNKLPHHGSPNVCTRMCVYRFPHT